MIIGLVANCQKSNIILENKVIQKMMLSKMSITKNVLLHSHLFNEKKNQKDPDDFWNRKLTLKVRFQHFLTPPPLHQFAKFNDLI